MASTVETLEQLHRRRARARRDGESEAVLNPATGEELARAPVSSAEDVDRAVRGGAAAFDGWSRRRPPSARRRSWRSPTLVEEHGEEIAALGGAQRGQADRGRAER